jgi:hypothetical protein
MEKIYEEKMKEKGWKEPLENISQKQSSKNNNSQSQKFNNDITGLNQFGFGSIMNNNFEKDLKENQMGNNIFLK